MEINIVKSKIDQLREGKILVIVEIGGDFCLVKLLQLYFFKAEILDNFKEYIFRLIFFFKKYKKFVFFDKYISYFIYREFFKALFKDIVFDILKYSIYFIRLGGALIAVNFGVKERIF